MSAFVTTPLILFTHHGVRPSTSSQGLEGLLEYGASPRASIALGLACRAQALPVGAGPTSHRMT